MRLNPLRLQPVARSKRATIRSAPPRGEADTGQRHYDFSPGRCHARVIEIGWERSKIILVDELLADPHSAIELAARDISFRTARDGMSHFPGVRSGAPSDYLATFQGALEPLIRDTYSIPSDLHASVRTMFSITTTSPARLMQLQRVPHYDAVEKRMISVVHYLFRKSFGGTCFFRHRATGFERMAPDREDVYTARLDSQLEEIGQLPDRYMTESNALFERTYDAEGLFNRLVIFEGQLLHSGTVNADAGLVQDPRAGRLTVNTFLTYGD